MQCKTDYRSSPPNTGPPPPSLLVNPGTPHAQTKIWCRTLLQVGMAAISARYAWISSQGSSRRPVSRSICDVRSQPWRFQSHPKIQKTMTTGRARYDLKKPWASLKPPETGQMET